MRRNFQIAIGVLWTTPVLLLLQYGLKWDRLPMRLATHCRRRMWSRKKCMGHSVGL